MADDLVAQLTFRVRVTPRAGVDRIESVDTAGELRVKLRAVPANGAANAALLRLLADALDLPVTAVSLVRGGRARSKLVAVIGVPVDRLVERWPGLVVGRKS